MIFIMKQAGHVWGHPRCIMVVVPLKIWSDYYRTNEIWYFARCTSPSFDEEISACLIHGLKARNRARRVEISSEKRTVHRVEVMSRRWNWIVECLQFVEVCICNKLFVVGNVDKKKYLCLRIKSKKIEKYVIYIFINSRIGNVEEIEIFLIRWT